MGLEKRQRLSTSAPPHPLSHLLRSETLDLCLIAVDLGGLLSTVRSSPPPTSAYSFKANTDHVPRLTSSFIPVLVPLVPLLDSSCASLVPAHPPNHLLHQGWMYENRGATFLPLGAICIQCHAPCHLLAWLTCTKICWSITVAMNLASYQTLPVDTSLGTGIYCNLYMQYHFFFKFLSEQLSTK